MPSSHDRGAAKILLLFLRAVEWIFVVRFPAITEGLSQIAPSSSADPISEKVDHESQGLLDSIRTVPGYEGSGERSLEMTKWAVELDDKRSSTIESKASSLTSQAGVALTIVFGLGAFLLEQLHPAREASFGALSILYVASLVSLFVAAAFGNAVLKVSETRGPAQSDLFNLQTIVSPERNAFLADHVWKIYRWSVAVNELKATRLARGQRFLSLGLFLVLMMAVIVVFYGR